ncbi:DNA recombination protein RmuC [Microbacterium gorillae]|uniref:DNA recombination protein RmuC n=1 Tax=Microbacterium gorillae TaxID=1231063 RepID=UPI00058F4D7B|nr:DNA recombination protein RmuC [Microbacterium gorillae]
MDALLIAIASILCLAAGLALGWFLRARVTTDDTALLARLAASEARAAELRDQVGQHRALLQQTQEQARADRDVQRERDRREASVLTALGPVQETLQQMHRSVSSLERDRQAQFGALSEQLRRAQESDDELRQATHSLAGALRSTTARGTWGEAQLRRLVEAAGMTAHVDFELQATITAPDGTVGRPDLLVRLPGGKALAVDAKAPMDAFLTASALEDADQAPALRQHAKAVRGHVDALAKRAYWAGLESSPELVVCFLPSEAMLSAALEADPTLLDHAFAQRVALASPVTLWSVLKSVAYTWTQQDVTAQAHELFRLGNQLYERLGTLAGHASDLRSSLEKTVTAYNRFAGSLESRVLVTARRFPGIDATKLDAVAAPGEVDVPARGFTAVELTTEATDDEAPATIPVTGADIGALRARLNGH